VKLKHLSLLSIVAISFGWPTNTWSRLDVSWQLTEESGIAVEAWAPETKGKFLALSYSCDAASNRCGLYLSLPIDCENAANKIVAVPVKLGRQDEVAHLKCIGPGGWMEYQRRGATRVYNMGKLSADGDPVRVDLFVWSVDLPKYKEQAVPNLEEHKTITFILGESEYRFTLKRSHNFFQKVYDSARPQN
jgi:hypothetical protein